MAQKDFERSFEFGHKFPHLFYNQINIVETGLHGRRDGFAHCRFVGHNTLPICGDPPLRASYGVIRVFLILRPHGRIGFDISGDAIHFLFVADDVLVIIALPDGDSIRAAQTVDPPRRK